MSDLVTIIIPTYNRAYLIGDTLDSIAAQTYKNWECIVVDDGSTDHTEQLLKEYSIKDNRFVFVKRPSNLPKGANACRNYGLSISHGEFINWFDSDDVMVPNKLEKQLEVLLQNTTSPFCLCQTQWQNRTTGEDFGLRSKNLDSPNRLEDYILYKSYWSILAPLWRRVFIERNQLEFNESLHQSQEYDFHIRALEIDDNYVYTDDVLAIMFQHQTNLSADIYSNDLKIQSNLKVKKSITLKHLQNFTSSGKLKWLEVLTLYYKTLLVHKKTNFAKQSISLIFLALSQLELSRLNKFGFKVKIIIAYISFVLFSKGYTLVKPLT